MAAITGNQCGFVPPEGGRPCARRVKNGEARCWQHKDARASGEPKQPLTMEQIERQRELIEEFAAIAAPTSIPLGNPDNFRTAMVREFTPIALDALKAVDKAFKSSKEDLSVPSEANKSFFEKGLDWFVDLILQDGIDEDRVSKMKVAGFNRMTTSGKKQSSDDGHHEVVVIDAGKPTEAVVDPYIAKFAPVRESGTSVEEQLPNGETPFGDLPWIGTVRDYVSGDYLWWDKFKMERGGR